MKLIKLHTGVIITEKQTDTGIEVKAHQPNKTSYIFWDCLYQLKEIYNKVLSLRK